MSWSHDLDRWEQDYETSPAGRYQAAHDRSERVRMREGWTVPDGWVRPVDPPCRKRGHRGYGMVRGECGYCVLERRVVEAEAAA